MKPVFCLAAMLLLMACRSPTHISQRHPADAFLAGIAVHCGKAYAGRIVANRPEPATPGLPREPPSQYIVTCMVYSAAGAASAGLTRTSSVPQFGQVMSASPCSGSRPFFSS